MGIPGQYKHERMKAAFETVAKAARSHGKAMGVGGVRQDFEFQSWLIGIGMRYLTGGSDVGYILSAGRADVKQSARIEADRMIRLATPLDIPRIFEIRDSVRENRLSDPGAVTEAHAAWFIANGALWVWQEADGLIAGFSGSDRRDGSIWALLVAPGHEGKGIGRALLKAACDALRAAGHRTAILSAEPGTWAERHYRAAGWSEAGLSAKGELLFRKQL